jgi:hypothetical protein
MSTLTEYERGLVAGYLAGQCKATTDYAVWQDGGQYVGVMREPLKKVIEEIKSMGVDACVQEALRMCAIYDL